MYIVAIAWIYVVLMVSVLQESVFRGIATFIFAGVLPLALLLFLVGTPQRRRNQKEQIEQASVGGLSDNLAPQTTDGTVAPAEPAELNAPAEPSAPTSGASKSL